VSALVGAGALARLALRRDRVRLTIWTVAIVGSVVAIARALPGIYPTAAERQTRATFAATPTAKALRGPGHGLDDYTIGAMLANEMLLYGLIAVALMSILVVVRHTRAEEESGRAELVRSAVVGAHAPTAAALLVVAGASVAIGALTALGLVVVCDDLSPAGSIAFGMSLTAAGLAFAGVGAVAAQVTEHARGAVGIGGLGLGVAFVLRALGDIGDGTLSWLSPLGWSQATRAYVDERWWPLLLSAGLAIALMGLAFALASRRDVDAGLVRPRPGPRRASALLASPFGLALRLQRAALLGWGAGVLLLGLAFGTVAGDAERFLADNPRIEEVFAVEGASVIDTLLALVVLILALLAAACAISCALRARSEELEERADAVLATALPRARWAASHLAVALAGGAAVLLVGAAGLGISTAIDQDDPAIVPRVLAAGLAHVAAVWVVVGVVAALFGLAPRASALGWAVLALAVFVGLLGEVLGLPQTVRALSPFEHVPPLPGGDVAVGPLMGLGGAAAALHAAGLAGFRRRDVNVR
jgi:ABC-2 type transport system permease protein